MSDCIECNDTGYVETLTYWCESTVDYLTEENPCEECAKYHVMVEEKAMNSFMIFLDYGGVSRVWDGCNWKSTCGKQFPSYVRARTYALQNLTEMLTYSNLSKDNIFIKECEVTPTDVSYKL